MQAGSLRVKERTAEIGSWTWYTYCKMAATAQVKIVAFSAFFWRQNPAEFSFLKAAFSFGVKPGTLSYASGSIATFAPETSRSLISSKPYVRANSCTACTSSAGVSPMSGLSISTLERHQICFRQRRGSASRNQQESVLHCRSPPR